MKRDVDNMVRVSGSSGGGSGGGDIIMPPFNDVIQGAHGVQANGFVGNILVTLDILVSASGISANGSLSISSIQASSNVSLNTISAQGAIGIVSVSTPDVVVYCSGIEGDGTVGIPTIVITIPDVTVPVSGVVGTGFVGDVTVKTALILESIFPNTSVLGNTIEIHFTGVGFDQPNLEIDISGSGITVQLISNVTSTTFNAIFQIAKSNTTTGVHDVLVQTDKGISNSRSFTVSRRKGG